MHIFCNKVFLPQNLGTSASIEGPKGTQNGQKNTLYKLNVSLDFYMKYINDKKYDCFVSPPTVTPLCKEGVWVMDIEQPGDIVTVAMTEQAMLAENHFLLKIKVLNECMGILSNQDIFAVTMHCC